MPTDRRASAFHRRRVVAGFTSAGALAGLALVAASPASAATAADCTVANTVTPTSLPSPTVVLQTLLDAATPIVCIDGAIVLTAELVTGGTVSLFGLGTAVLDGADTFRILSRGDVAHDITAEGIRFTGGRAAEGAAIQGGNVTIIDSTFDGNVTTGRGGAIRASAVDIAGSTFEDNSAGGAGGAVWFDTSGTVASSEFRRNTSDDFGGALASKGVVTLAASTFEDHVAVNNGGAVNVGTAVITGSTFARNSTTWPSSAGGAVRTNNATVTNSTFVGNSTPDWAGAIYSPLATISQSTFLDNIADWGQSIVSRGGTASTYAGNIFAGSGPGTQLADYDGAASGDLGGNVFSNAAVDEHTLVPVGPGTIFGQSPASIFGTEVLADNGGAVPTLALPTGSVAIDVVPAGSPVTTDARGWTRVAANDAGSFEFGAVDPTPPPPAGPAAAPAPTLPPTGSAPGLLATLAAGLLAIGALALTAVRRQRRA